MKVSAIALILGLMLGSSFITFTSGTISSSPTAVVSPFSCEKGTSYVITVDNAATPNYYAVAGSGSPTVPCGTLAYGGPGNVGGDTGTNATQVIASVITAVPNGGSITFAAGNYNTTRTIILPTTKTFSMICQSAALYGCSILYSGGSWAMWTGAADTLGWSPGALISMNNFRVGVYNASAKGGINATFAIVAMNNVGIFYSQANTPVAGMIGYFEGPYLNGEEMSGGYLNVAGFDTCVFDDIDHFTYAHVETSQCSLIALDITNGAGTTVNNGPTGTSIAYFHYYPGPSAHRIVPSTGFIFSNGFSSFLGNVWIEGAHTSPDVYERSAAKTITIASFINSGLGIASTNGPTSTSPGSTGSCGILTLSYSGPLASPAGWAIQQLAFPGSTVYYVNNYTIPLTVYITGIGTGITSLTQKSLCSSDFMALAVAAPAVGWYYTLNPGEEIKFTYTGSPTWELYGDA